MLTADDRRADRARCSSSCPRREARRRRSSAAARTCASGCSCSRTSAPAARVIRTHGDCHLGQTMLTPTAAGSILDFEGEPAGRCPSGACKRSPLRDVAGMLRSFSYAAAGARAAARRRARPRTGRTAPAQAFLEGYLETRRPVAAAAGRGRRPPSCWRSSSSRRPSTSCATSSTTGPTGSRSRSPGSCGCSSPSCDPLHLLPGHVLRRPAGADRPPCGQAAKALDDAGHAYELRTVKGGNRHALDLAHAGPRPRRGRAALRPPLGADPRPRRRLRDHRLGDDRGVGARHAARGSGLPPERRAGRGGRPISSTSRRGCRSASSD